jgi:hypothetical protein
MPIKPRHFTLNVLLPIIAGGLIYLCWRDPNLLMFRWISALGLQTVVGHLRLAVSVNPGTLPHWFLYSLPDGLWVYALTAIMVQIWRESVKTWPRLFWISLGLVIGAGSELGQLAGVVPGTFDLFDLCFSIFAAVAAFLIISLTTKRSLNESTV